MGFCGAHGATGKLNNKARVRAFIFASCFSRTGCHWLLLTYRMKEFECSGSRSSYRNQGPDIVHQIGGWFGRHPELRFLFGGLVLRPMVRSCLGRRDLSVWTLG